MIEGKLAIVGVVLLLSAPILLMIALGVRFGGANRVLNCIDPDRVREMREANRWAGNRLLVLPAYAVCGGVLSLQYTTFAVIALPAGLLVGGFVMAWVMTGVQRFHDRPLSSPPPISSNSEESQHRSAL
jgi:hypothetical protein